MMTLVPATEDNGDPLVDCQVAGCHRTESKELMTPFMHDGHEKLACSVCVITGVVAENSPLDSRHALETALEYKLADLLFGKDHKDKTLNDIRVAAMELIIPEDLPE